MITREQLTVGTRFILVDDEDKSVWTVCNNPDSPEEGQFTTWAHKPAVFATTPARWPEVETESNDVTNDGIVLFTEIAKILD